MAFWTMAFWPLALGLSLFQGRALAALRCPSNHRRSQQDRWACCVLLVLTFGILHLNVGLWPLNFGCYPEDTH